MDSVTTVIAAARQILPRLTTTRAQAHFHTAHKELLDEAQVRNIPVTLGSLVDGTREYDWAEGNLKAWDAVYYDSSTSFKHLEHVTEDWLDIYKPNWRAEAEEGDPDYYYITSSQDTDSAKKVIGFYPIPDTTTSGGYPKVIVEATQFAELTTSETLPSTILHSQFHIYRVCELAAPELAPGRLEEFSVLATREKARQVAHVRNLAGRTMTQMLPPITGFKQVT
jgi:hypothetical protein